MVIRVVYCEDESHPLSWVRASDCNHWSVNCPRAKKAKKPRHKLVKNPVGFPVMTNGLTESDGPFWPYNYDQPEYVLELIEKYYSGNWVHDRLDEAMNYRWPQGSYWKPTIPGLLFECSTGCGLIGAE